MQDQDPNEQVFLDIMIGNEEIGRITIELFSNIVPKTAANFKSLCLNLNGKSYKTSKFHRIIKDFMIQGGDYENNDGTGGTSIYPEQNGYFKDENFKIVHDQAMLLSMANIGPNTNGSQFFITSKATPHLDKKHVVFGRIIKGQEVFRRIEKVRCDENDVPLKDVIIYHCGEIQVEPVVKKVKVKKIKEIESEKESSDGEVNPYVIGVKPPAEFESSQSFLSGVGKSTFRVHKRPKDSKDSSGRTIRGRGTMVLGYFKTYNRALERRLMLEGGEENGIETDLECLINELHQPEPIPIQSNINLFDVNYVENSTISIVPFPNGFDLKISNEDYSAVANAEITEDAFIKPKRLRKMCNDCLSILVTKYPTIPKTDLEERARTCKRPFSVKALCLKGEQ